MELTFGSLFAGIGGFDLGFERAGWQCKWQVEIDPYCRRVLAKHWPDVPKWDDVRTFPPEHGEWGVDCIVGGFPCQDISNAGKRAGIDGERSGLWSEYIRIVRALRPRIVVVENVAALLGRGMDRVLGDLAESGFDAEWDCVSAASCGARHLRNRIFIVAYSRIGEGEQRHGIELQRGRSGETEQVGVGSRRVDGDATDACMPKEKRFGQYGRKVLSDETTVRLDGVRSSFSDTDGTRPQIRQVFGGNAQQELATIKRDCSTGTGIWATEPDVGRVADGIPSRVDRLRGLGNAVVPQVAQYIAHRIAAHVTS